MLPLGCAALQVSQIRSEMSWECADPYHPGVVLPPGRGLTRSLCCAALKSCNTCSWRLESHCSSDLCGHSCFLQKEKNTQNVVCPTGGVLLRHVSVLHAVHTVLPWSHSTWCFRWNPLLHHARLSEAEGVGGMLFICGPVGVQKLFYLLQSQGGCIII